MAKWFYKQNKILQVVLLLIPFVNWIVELVVRWSVVLEKKGSDILQLVAAIVVTIGGLFIGWLDAIWVLLTDHLILAKD